MAAAAVIPPAVVIPRRLIVGVARGVETSDILPSQTLYCNNLNDKVHLQDLVANLYEACCPYGEVINIVSQKGATKRGQAFVVFREIGSATAALRAFHGREFLGKPIRIQYAKTKSDAVCRLEGTFKPRKPGSKRGADGVEKTTEQAEANSTRKNQTVGHFTLCVENLPDKINKAAMDILFGQYPGHTESRLIEGRGVAFIDFATELQAEVSMQGLQGFRVTPEHAIKISWAKQ